MTLTLIRGPGDDGHAGQACARGCEAAATQQHRKSWQAQYPVPMVLLTAMTLTLFLTSHRAHAVMQAKVSVSVSLGAWDD